MTRPHCLGRVKSHKPLRKCRKGGKRGEDKKENGGPSKTPIAPFTPYFPRNCPEGAGGSSKLVCSTVVPRNKVHTVYQEINVPYPVVYLMLWSI